MIKLEIDSESLSGVRIAGSPLWDTLSSLALLARYGSQVPDPYTGWATRTRVGMNPVVLTHLVRWMGDLHPLRLPDVFTPPPRPCRTTLHGEVAAVRATPRARRLASVRETYPAGAPDGVRALTEDDGLTRFLDLIEEYWSVAIDPYQSSIDTVLGEEILARGRTLATAGAHAMLTGLGGRLAWEPPVLVAPHQLDLTRRIVRGQLLIVPSLFARGMRIFAAGPGGVTAISYQARGAGILDHECGPVERGAGMPEEDDGLAALVGRGRAAVMRTLTVPATTTSIASTLRVAPSTVSQHLAALSSAGIVTRCRVGVRVLYELDHGGLALLEHVDRRRRPACRPA